MLNRWRGTAAVGWLLAALATLLPSTASAGRPHEHGVARLDIAADPARITLLLELPLDSLLGFEREPRSDEERKQADLAITRLRAAGALFRIDPAAGCTPGKVDLQSPVLGLGAQAAAVASKEGHADIDASYDFVCKDGNRAGFVEVGLFDFFPRLQRVEVQAATRKGQLKATLKRPVSRVPLAR